jgi:hypothetical protein
MRTVSESKFARLKNRKGVTVKRKLGAQKLTKTSKSAVPDNMPLSGDRTSEPLASASDPRFNQLTSMIMNNTKVIEQFRKGLMAIQAILNAPKESWIHAVKRKDKLISTVVSTSGSRTVVHKIHRNNKNVIESISTRNA